MSGRLEGKVALVTGAASGMGAVAAQRFAREGASVVLGDVSADGERVAAQIRAHGGEAVFVTADVAVGESVAAMVQTAIESYGALDVLYNNAGIGPPDDAAIHELSDEVWDRVMAINVRGVYLCCKHAIPTMLEHGTPGGSIVNTASIAGLTGNSTLPSTAYTISKGAVMALTKQVAVSYAAQGIRCNAMCPGPILTPILEPFFAQEGVRERFEQRIPLGRMGQPEDVVNLALFLASDESSWITGELIVIDGGILAT